VATSTPELSGPELPPISSGARFLFFSELVKRSVCAGKIRDRVGRVGDLVFALKDPYPEAVGIYMEYGWGKPTQLVPWEKVLRVDDDAIFVEPPPEGSAFPPFVDQPGWIMIGQHLIGRTILDMDGRRIEVVNDVQFLEAKGRLLLIHVDTSFNGFLRRWGLGGLNWLKGEFISWKYVQPLSLEYAVATDRLELSVTRRRLKELPCEDLADALEQLSGKEQEALFSVLDSEKAAETLAEAEPRVKRQIVGRLRKEHARLILGEMAIPQLAKLMSALPHDDAQEMMRLLPPESRRRLSGILAEDEPRARELMDGDYVTFPAEATVGQVLDEVRRSGRSRSAVSYIYVVGSGGQPLLGVVDLRELVLEDDGQRLGDIMASPPVAAEADLIQAELAQIFTKYHYRMLPVVDAEDRLLGVIRYNDIMRGSPPAKE
jgi:CBS domain-containing protein/sporulation protein YlmC with PRC-barrel domain